MMRLFVALPLPESLRRRLAGLAGGVREARWINPENLHLTLRFIGEIREDVLYDIERSLESVRAPAFTFSLAGAGHFESRKRVHALWIGVDASPALATLQERIEFAVQRAGCAPDRRRFSAHVTLARLKGAPPSHVRQWLEINSLFRAEPVVATSFTLYRSHLGRGGAHYVPLRLYALEGAAE